MMLAFLISQDCEVAWDQAEELLAHKSHKKVCSDW
jgi:hypothetical protein